MKIIIYKKNEKLLHINTMNKLVNFYFNKIHDIIVYPYKVVYFLIPSKIKNNNYFDFSKINHVGELNYNINMENKIDITQLLIKIESIYDKLRIMDNKINYILENYK